MSLKALRDVTCVLSALRLTGQGQVDWRSHGALAMAILPFLLRPLPEMPDFAQISSWEVQPSSAEGAVQAAVTTSGRNTWP